MRPSCAGKHQPAVPVLQRTVRGPHEVEKGKTSAVDSLLKQLPLNVVVAKHVNGATVIIDGRSQPPRA